MKRWKFLCLTGTMLLGLACQREPAPTTVSLTDTASELELFGKGLISTHLYERDIAISPDGEELIYTAGDYRQTVRCLVRMKWSNGEWNGPDILPLSGRWHDIEPFITPDGTRLYFASNRPLPDEEEPGDYNLWVSALSEGEWADPVPLPEGINTPDQEFFPSVASSGNLYFTATREEGPGREDIYVSRWENGEFQSPVPLDTSINTSAFEFNAWISPEENLLIFSSFGREDGLGGGDLYLSRTDSSGSWLQAIHLPKGINSDKLDYCPFVDLPRGNFYFTSDRASPHTERIRSIEDLNAVALDLENGMGNIYRISADSLP